MYTIYTAVRWTQQARSPHVHSVPCCLTEHCGYGCFSSCHLHANSPDLLMIYTIDYENVCKHKVFIQLFSHSTEPLLVSDRMSLFILKNNTIANCKLIYVPVECSTQMFLTKWKPSLHCRQSDLFPEYVGFRRGCPWSLVLLIIFMDRFSGCSRGPEEVWFGDHRIS